MPTEKIIKGGSHEFLGDFLPDLPDNTMLNKVQTGSGMTHLALYNNVKYVVAMPFTALIENKLASCKRDGIDVCAVYAKGDKYDDVLVFKGNKIMVTYDSFGIVTKALKDKGDLKDWKVLIDESHKLVDSAAFRPRAIKSVLDNYGKYKSFVFGTATPIDDRYLLPKLRHIPKTRIEWDNIKPIKVNYCHYDIGINDATAIVAIDFLSNIRTGNAHFFINSVDSICSIIRKLKQAGYDEPNNINIVCSDNEYNRNKIEKALSKKYSISQAGKDARKLNFYTSTAFEGCDIKDKEGKCIIVADGSKDHTKINLMTTLPQIVNRIRDSNYKNEVELLYSSNSYFSHLSEKDYETEIKYNLDRAQQLVEDYYSYGRYDMARIALQKDKTNPFVIWEGENVSVNENAWYNHMYNFNTLKHTYHVSKYNNHNYISDGTKTFNGIRYIYKSIDRVEIKGLNKVKLKRRANYPDLCFEFFKIYDQEPSLKRSAELGMFKKQEPLIDEAFHVLGRERMKTLKYRRKDIKNELKARDSIIRNAPAIVLKLYLKAGQWISKNEAKVKIQEVYNKLGITTNATSKHLENWYTLKEKNRNIKGKRVKGYVIVNCNINQP